MVLLLCLMNVNQSIITCKFLFCQSHEFSHTNRIPQQPSSYCPQLVDMTQTLMRQKLLMRNFNNEQESFTSTNSQRNMSLIDHHYFASFCESKYFAAGLIKMFFYFFLWQIRLLNCVHKTTANQNRINKQIEKFADEL